ncbi:lectin-like domain-containing protein, partial [Convivina praedatoris]
MKSNNIFDRNSVKTHFKMYKSGKLWLVSGISLFTLGLGGSANVSADTTAKADTTDDQSVTSVQSQPTLVQQSQVVLSPENSTASRSDSATVVEQSASKSTSLSQSQADAKIKQQQSVSNEDSLSNSASQATDKVQRQVGATQSTTGNQGASQSNSQTSTSEQSAGDTSRHQDSQVDTQTTPQTTSATQEVNTPSVSVSQTLLIQDMGQATSQANSTSLSQASSQADSQSDNTQYSQDLSQAVSQANSTSIIDSASNVASQSDSTLLAHDLSVASSLAIQTAASQSTSREQVSVLAQAASQSEAQTYVIQDRMDALRDEDDNQLSFRAATATSVATNKDDKAGRVTVTDGTGINDVFSKPTLDPTGKKINNAAQINADGSVVLTEDKQSQVGSIATKDKIDLQHDFHMSGTMDIGQTGYPKGGDGIGIAFSKENTGSVGYSGGFNGIGGLRDVTGFKLDSFPNDAQAPNPKGTTPEEKLGFPADWKGEDSNGIYRRPYGAFVSTDDHGYINIDDGSQQIAGENRTPKRLSWAFQNNRNTPFSVDYNASTKLMTITYGSATTGVLKWSKYLSDADIAQPVGLSIAASTGGSTNRQTFQLTSMDYYRAATVNVKYMDEAGNEIAKGDVTYPNGWQKGKTYQTKTLDLSPNYKYLGLAPGSLPANGNLGDWGDNGTVTYLYHYITPAESTSASQSDSSSKSNSISKSASQSESTKSASTSTSVSGSESKVKSESASTSASVSGSDSKAKSESISTSTSASGSDSASTESASASTSTSESVSGSTSASKSASTSTSVSGSDSKAKSESISTSTSASGSDSASTESASASTSTSESVSGSTSASKSASTSTSVSGSDSKAKSES